MSNEKPSAPTHGKWTGIPFNTIIHKNCKRCGEETDHVLYRRKVIYGSPVCKRCIERKKKEAREKTKRARRGDTPWPRDMSPEEKDAYYKELQRKSYYKRTYGISLEDYKEMLAAQSGRCSICGIHQDNVPKGRWLAVDHCHHTGKVRGLLCLHCNTGIGKLQDDVFLLQAAIDYLNSHSSST